MEPCSPSAHLSQKKKGKRPITGMISLEERKRKKAHALERKGKRSASSHYRGKKEDPRTISSSYWRKSRDRKTNTSRGRGRRRL